jgi:transcriptional regulator of NAD metabolism
VFRTKNIVKHLVSAPKNIHFYIIMMRTAYFVVRDAHDLKHFSENSKKRSGVRSLVQRVIGSLRRITKRKKI